jgi:hypothetical protein
MQIRFTPPAHGASAFNCPLCGAFAEQVWASQIFVQFQGAARAMPAPKLKICRCRLCGGDSLWVETQLVYPDAKSAPSANEDLPLDVATDYEEARNILSRSPRGAAALLRLAIQKLCAELGEPGENINDNIASLVRKGLPVQVQQALDAVRVIGNEAVYPGQIEVSDNPEIATALFGLVNFIAEKMISEPKAIEHVYRSLPPEKLAAIQRRDGRGEP